MNILIASNNKHKIDEIKSILGVKFDNIYSLSDLDIHCDPEENGVTFLENALIKAREIAQHTTFAVLADDTGLCVDALGGAPGVHSARYAGTENDSYKNKAKLLDALNGVTNRNAHFETVVVLRFPDGREIIGTGRVDGEILCKEYGDTGFGYDNIFFCTELNKSFGTATPTEKNTVSHRARALLDLLTKI
jgi:XTP/dITP diphosphohydrolase